MKIIGIYKITNNLNGNTYVGQSVNIYKRWNKHKESSFNPKSTSYNTTICKAIRKHGLENFTFEIIEECEKEKLDEREIYWISTLNTYQKGYNETLGGQGSAKGPSEKIFGIIKDLKETTLYHREIADRWNVC